MMLILSTLTFADVLDPPLHQITRIFYGIVGPIRATSEAVSKDNLMDVHTSEQLGGRWLEEVTILLIISKLISSVYTVLAVKYAKAVNRVQQCPL